MMTPATDISRRNRLLHAAGLSSVGVALMLIALKLWAWIETGSVALLSSLADSTLDLLASGVTYLALRVAMKPADEEHRFGHGSAEAVAGIFQAMIITASAVLVAARAVSRILQPEPVSEPMIGYSVMAISLLLTAGLVLFQRHVSRQTGSLAVAADSLHYGSDFLGNIAVIAALILSDTLGWLRADPLLALLVVVIILLSVRDILIKALDDLLDREFQPDERDLIMALATAHPDVLGAHELRTRSSGAAQFIQLHLELHGELRLARVHDICDEVEATLRRHFPAAEVLIHADPYGLRESDQAAD